MMAKVTSVASANNGSNASSTPTAVATPLPPLKAKNTGYRWPKNAASPASACAPSLKSHAGPNHLTSITGSQPLAASSSSVTMAAGFEPERSTLVAPGLPLP